MSRRGKLSVSKMGVYENSEVVHNNLQAEKTKFSDIN